MPKDPLFMKGDNGGDKEAREQRNPLAKVQIRRW